MKIPESTILVIFGASGDLAYRKLIPAIYSLSQQKLLPDNFFILGVGRSAISDDAFRKLGNVPVISAANEMSPESDK